MYDQQYFVRFRGRVSGPFSVAQLQALHRCGQFGRFHEVSADRRTWTSASSLTEIFPAAGPNLPALPDVVPAVMEAVTGYPDRGPEMFTPAAGPSLASWEEQQGWRRVRTGLTLLIVSMLTWAGAVFLITFGVVISVAGENPAGLAASLLIFYILLLAVRVVEAVGEGFLAAAPSACGGKGWAVAAFVLALLWPLFYLLLLMGPRALDELPLDLRALHFLEAWGTITLAAALLVLAIDAVRYALVLRFLRAAAAHLQAPDLAGACSLLLVVYAVFWGVLALEVGVWSASEVAVLDRSSSGALAFLLILIWVLALSSLVLGLFWFIRFLVALFQLRTVVVRVGLHQP